MSLETPTPKWTESTASKGPFRSIGLRELWDFKDLVWFFALRDVKVRYKQTLLGVAWVVLGPLAAMLIFNALLGRLKGLSSDDLPYPVFVLSGFILWTSFSSAVTNAALRLVETPDLVTKVYFPRLVAPLAAVLAPLLDLAVALLVLAIVAAAYGVDVGFQLLLLPVWLLASTTLAFGVGALLSALNVQYRDVRHALPFMMQLWFFSSPVVFGSSIVEGTGRLLLALNPVVGLLDGFRWSVVGGPPPPLADLASLASGLLLTVVGILYFQRVERRFADVI